MKKNHPEISFADLWAVAACCAIEFLGGPKIPYAHAYPHCLWLKRSETRGCVKRPIVGAAQARIKERRATDASLTRTGSSSGAQTSQTTASARPTAASPTLPKEPSEPRLSLSRSLPQPCPPPSSPGRPPAWVALPCLRCEDRLHPARYVEGKCNVQRRWNVGPRDCHQKKSCGCLRCMTMAGLGWDVQASPRCLLPHGPD